MFTLRYLNGPLPPTVHSPLVTVRSPPVPAGSTRLVTSIPLTTQGGGVWDHDTAAAARRATSAAPTAIILRTQSVDSVTRQVRLRGFMVLLSNRFHCPG